MNRRRVCEATGKRRFRDHREAVRVLHTAVNARSRGEDERRERRCYDCKECNGWHLTSQVNKRLLIDPAATMSKGVT